MLINYSPEMKRRMQQARERKGRGKKCFIFGTKKNGMARELAAGKTGETALAAVKAKYRASQRILDYCAKNVANIYGLCTGKRAHGIPEKFLKGKRIVDIGCGSRNACMTDSMMGNAGMKEFEPWLCRIAHEAGARVTGVDIQPLDGEEFEHFQADMENNRPLRRFTGGAFDIVVSQRMTGGGADSSNISPALRKANGQNTVLFRLFSEARRLLREGGVFVHNNKSFVKINGLLHPFYIIEDGAFVLLGIEKLSEFGEASNALRMANRGKRNG